MPDSPLSATPYEVLGVNPSAPHDELRRAYRRLLRQTHPDAGGDAKRFIEVQLAWELVATPAMRSAYDARSRLGRNADDEQVAWETPRTSAPRRDTRPAARSYGHPGGWRRERFLDLMREWVGRGVALDNPYDPQLVRSAPREVRHMLADALAEEATARALSTLGIGFTIWHDVATGAPHEKIDHVVLGATGLFAILSEDFGGPVRVRRGELIGDAVAGEQPVASLAARAKAFARVVRVKPTALVIVLPDDAIDEAMIELGQVRGARAAVARRSFLPALVRDGMPGARQVGGTEVFDVRTKLQNAIRFVE